VEAHDQDQDQALNWTKRALCRDYPQLWFHASRQEDQAQVDARCIRICDVCPVQDECLLEGLGALQSTDGMVWGGLTSEERLRARISYHSEPIDLFGEQGWNLEIRSNGWRSIGSYPSKDEAARALRVFAQARRKRTA
jgi:hypothetical protein